MVKQNRVVIDVKLKSLTYCHLLNDAQRHFTLIDHSGSWGLNSWNLVTEENLKETVGILRRIVDEFESSLD